MCSSPLALQRAQSHQKMSVFEFAQASQIPLSLHSKPLNLALFPPVDKIVDYFVT